MQIFHTVITGRIGTGKTTYARKLLSKLQNNQQNATLKVIDIDYDEIAHSILSNEFNITTRAERKKLAKTIFESEESRTKWESDLHYKIYETVSKTVQNACKTVQNATKFHIIHQIPLYERTKQLFIDHFGKPNEIVKLEATDEEIVKRLVDSRKMSETDIRNILQHQKDV